MGKVGTGLLFAGTAGAAQASATAGGPDPGYVVVPPAERLTFGGIIGDASPEVQAVMTLLALAALAAVVIWATGLTRIGRGDAKGLAGALSRLKIVRSAGAPLGALAASYILMSGFIGLANVRPTPTVAVLAPGWAEAALAVMLGLLATTVAVLCERHLEGRIRQAAA